MKKIVSTLALAVSVFGTAVAFDEDNTRAEAAAEVVAEVAPLPQKPVQTVAMSDDDFAAEQQDFVQFYDELAQLAQADIPSDTTVE